MRKLLSSVLLAVMATFAAPSFADVTPLDPPVPVSDPSKVEVVEMFSFGCIHCYHFDPELKQWLTTQPSDVDFKRVPAIFSPAWEVYAQTFYALQAMGEEPKVHDAIFVAIHDQKVTLSNADEIADFLAGKGIDKDTFLKNYNSFAVKSQVENARKLGEAYQITGVPTMIVNGRYRVDMGNLKGPDELFPLLNSLIEKERATLKKP